VAAPLWLVQIKVRVHMKISTMSSAEIRNAMDNNASFDPKKCYIISQPAHIVCKKDHHEMLSETVSDDLSTAYDTLQASPLVFIRELDQEKVKCYYISKHAYDICIKEDDYNCALTYSLETATDNGFSIKYTHGKKL
jgi:hypothetical protein